MDDRLFDIFSEETDVPKCVQNRIDETLEMLESVNCKNLEKPGKKTWKRSLFFSFAAVLAFGATVFAAEKYMGISSFFSTIGAKMPEEAQALIEKEPVQQEDGDSIITYTVKEALCDKNSVQIVVEATAKERGKYLLVGQDIIEEDKVNNLGINSDLTVGEYAKEKGLTVVRVGASFDFGSDLGIVTAVGSYSMQEDDVLDIYSSAVKQNQSSDLIVSCVGTAALPDAEQVEDIMRTNITFKLEDKSQGRTVTYMPVTSETNNSSLTADGKVKLLSVDVEETELAEYVTIHYIMLEKSEDITLDVTDSEGNVWQISNLGGYAPIPEVGQEAVQQINYEKTELPDEIGIRAYDHENGTAYEPVLFVSSKN